MTRIKYNILFFPDKERDGDSCKPDGKLRIRVRWAGAKVDFNVGYRVRILQWDTRTQRCVAKTTNLQKQSASLINGRIQHYGDVLENIFKAAELSGSIPTPDDVRAKFNEATGRDNKAANPTDRSLFDYFDLFMCEMGSLNNWALSTNQKLRTARSHLKNYNSNLSFSDLTDAGLSKYVNFLRDDCQMRNTTIGKQLDFLKWFLRWATANGACQTLDYVKFKPKLKTNDKKIIFLDQSELMAVYGHEFSNETLARVRDVFCFCCFTSLRYSDVANLRRADVSANHIDVTTIKTGSAVRIELNKYSRAILDKYAVQEFPDDLTLPVISNQKMNDYLKDIGKACGIDTLITVTYYRGNERIDEVHPKYELIGTHAGRRTFICNALALGIPAQVVMKWTGHSDYKAMKPYIDIADDIKANAMSRFNAL